MKTQVTVLLIAASTILVACRSNVKTIYVSPTSEQAKGMLELDARGRAVQNKPLFTKSLQDYETAHGGSCPDVAFVRLHEPGRQEGTYVRRYTMEGTSGACGTNRYQTRITFRDMANTVARKVEVLGRIVQ